MKPRVRLLGGADLGIAAEIPGSLEQLIYDVTAKALDDASLEIGQIDAVCMGASDLLDGRAISTMTLTGSTGSLGKSELRVCDDGLAAVIVAAMEICSGAAQRMTVSAWSKLSDVDLHAIDPLSLEPAFHRGLGIGPREIRGLRESAASGAVATVDESTRWGADTAVTLVLGPAEGDGTGPFLTGFGSAMGRYLVPGDPLLEPAATAARRAVESAGHASTAVPRVYVAGMDSFDDDEVRRSFDLGDHCEVVRPLPDGAEVGYASGLFALRQALVAGQSGLSLVVCAGGVGLQSAHAVVMEVS